MNERIRQLAEQARQEFLELPTGYTPEQVGMYPQLMQKFAELIVRECAEQSMSIGRYNTPSNITPDLAIAIAVGLKKHFGVEE